jgi:hypothetical protein
VLAVFWVRKCGTERHNTILLYSNGIVQTRAVFVARLRNETTSRVANWGSHGATLPALGNNLRPHSSNPGARRGANGLSACFFA